MPIILLFRRLTEALWVESQPGIHISHAYRFMFFYPLGLCKLPPVLSFPVPLFALDTQSRHTCEVSMIPICTWPTNKWNKWRWNWIPLLTVSVRTLREPSCPLQAWAFSMTPWWLSCPSAHSTASRVSFRSSVGSCLKLWNIFPLSEKRKSSVS